MFSSKVLFTQILFMIYSKSLSIAQIAWCQITKWFAGNE